MTLIILALVTTPITLPLTVRLALGRDEVEVFVLAVVVGLILAGLGGMIGAGLAAEGLL